MALNTLTQKLVDNCACPEDKKKEVIYDDKCKGLILEVRPTGVKTFYLRYKGKRGKYKQLKLGRASFLSVAQARELAKNTLANIAMGKDPQEEKRILKQVPTFESFTQDQYLPFIRGYKKSWQTDEQILRLHILPRFGKKHLDEITQEELITFHKRQLESGYAPASANRAIIIINYMFNLAIQ
ncbi:integrase arm-type DNA-binding domain-containing protein [Desulfonatronospira thiodismutans]|uniref:integrase arm-type DNA-binding domain-containing protein n=1 Tax=Desulfonatronospira thiodismutans TaxID=488939 RepID=UPI000197587A|nr:integrase arm-type DNA-binding domain-containing protein [Desulfonatronospira thiodismutans]